jgi:hypothetical protein
MVVTSKRLILLALHQFPAGLEGDNSAMGSNSIQFPAESGLHRPDPARETLRIRSRSDLRQRLLGH